MIFLINVYKPTFHGYIILIRGMDAKISIYMKGDGVYET